MVRTRTSPQSRIDSQKETALILSFVGSTDGQKRRIRLLARRGEDGMWRIEERWQDGDWEVVSAEPITELQLSLPHSVPELEHHADVDI
jgi:hypothetical protein